MNEQLAAGLTALQSNPRGLGIVLWVMLVVTAVGFISDRLLLIVSGAILWGMRA